MAAIYLRLSRDDGGDAESNSIANQREMLLNYCKQNQLAIYGEYVDDGVSGLTFERNGFKQMISDIENSKVGAVVCKDLSRLGRNNALVAYYTEIYFLENNVRFIAVNDNIDSAVGENEIMGFKSVINEFYARDISKKIRSVKSVLQQKGKRTGGQPPLGYMPDSLDKNHYVIDPENAPLVLRMFNMAAEGASIHSIARTFTEEGILSPRDIQQGSDTGVEWSVTSVGRMLKNKVYLGCMVYNTHYKPSFKSSKVIKVDEADWIVVPDRHEPLIKQELFDLVQKRIGVKKRKPKLDFDNVFVGIVKCYDCGNNMSLGRDSRKGDRIFFLNCHRYRQFSKEKRCTMHYINYEFLYELVLKSIQQNITVVNANEQRQEQFIQAFIREAVAKTSVKFQNSDEANFDRLTRRKDELDKIIQKLFESSAVQSLSSDAFHEMLAKYDKERTEVLTQLGELKTRLSEKTDDGCDYRRFFELIKKYRGEEKLTATMVNELIEKIVVHESNGCRKNREQQVDIYYRFAKNGLTGLGL
ncbi:MAG: recombinase family protein [Oscillospiraceae bacterium]|nr:recombinase family protein [Oscillospiraceae bacterium]